MKVILFGASGMVGQGVLRQCLRDDEVTSVLVVGRTSIEKQHEKLREILLPDLFKISSIEEQLRGYDACFFCIGVTSAGMKETDYLHWTYDLTILIAQAVLKANPELTFVFVSGMGTDSTEKGPAMWARVKGKAENELQRMPLKAAYMFRPGVIQPLHGIKSKTALYRIPYMLLGPIIPVLLTIFPQYVTTTERIGRAMINVARRGWPAPILESRDINKASE